MTGEETDGEFSRFLQAQARVYPQVLDELRRGRKESHWMWFIFPQLRGLGSSGTAWTFGLDSLETARSYLAHPVLGQRLRDCTALLLEGEKGGAEEIFGYPDDLKLRSCLTLFDLCEGGESVFRAALDRFFGGQADPRTLELLGIDSA